jgi:hypothetical protein
VQTVSRVKGVGYEAIFVCILIGDAESCAWHCAHRNITGHSDRNFRLSNKVEQSHQGYSLEIIIVDSGQTDARSSARLICLAVGESQGTANGALRY